MRTFTKTFWADAAERATKTAAQAAILALGAGAIDALSVPWESVLGFALGGALLSLLTSIASAGAGDKGTASLVELEPNPADPDSTLD